MRKQIKPEKRKKIIFGENADTLAGQINYQGHRAFGKAGHVASKT